MKATIRRKNGEFNSVLALDKAISRLPKLSSKERQILQDKQRFDSVFYSNRLEGNKLTRNDARKAIAMDLK